MIETQQFILRPNWEFCFGGDWKALSFHLCFISPPSALNRWLMQKLLGIHWRKIKC